MSTSSPSSVYQQVEVNTSNNLKLVVMLYEGAIRFLGEAREAIVRKDVRGKAVSLDRALSIIGELQSTLRLDEGGDIANSLNSLYTFMNENLLEASARMDVRPVEQVIRLLRTLNSAWTEISRKSEAQQAAATAPAAYSAVGAHAGEHRPIEVFG